MKAQKELLSVPGWNRRQIVVQVLPSKSSVFTVECLSFKQEASINKLCYLLKFSLKRDRCLRVWVCKRTFLLISYDEISKDYTDK